MRRKYKPQKIGLNPNWFKKYIFEPMIKVCTIAAVITFVLYQYNSYSEKRAIIEKEERLIKESIAAEEREKQESIRVKEEAKIEEERKKESLAQIEIERRKTNTLYENKVSKKIVPVGTYLKNNKLNKVGRVISYYGLEVITNNDWNFTIDGNGVIPDEVVIIGYAEYTNRLKAQKEKEEKKNRKTNADKLQQLLDDELRELTKKTKAKLRTPYILIGTQKYRVWEIKGDQLYCTKKNDRKKKSNYVQITYTDKIKCLNYIDYENDIPK